MDTSDLEGSPEHLFLPLLMRYGKRCYERDFHHYFQTCKIQNREIRIRLCRFGTDSQKKFLLCWLFLAAKILDASTREGWSRMVCVTTMKTLWSMEGSSLTVTVDFLADSSGNLSCLLQWYQQIRSSHLLVAKD